MKSLSQVTYEKSFPSQDYNIQIKATTFLLLVGLSIQVPMAVQMAGQKALQMKILMVIAMGSQI